MPKIRNKIKNTSPVERLEGEVVGLMQDETLDRAFNDHCAKLENDMVKRVFRAFMGRKLTYADYQLFKIVSLEGQPNRYNIYLKEGNILLGEVIKSFSRENGFSCRFEPNKPQNETV